LTALVESQAAAAVFADVAHDRGAVVLGVGTAVPPVRWSAEETFRRMAAAWGLRYASLHRWRRIVEGSEIEHRHAVMPPDETIGLSTGQRMRAYERLAPGLAASAAQSALGHAGVDPAKVTDLVIVSCTGFSAPGVDVALIERLRLKPTTRRTTIGFMGCFGAINGMRVASALCHADQRAITLLVCVELCSLHMRDDGGVQNQVASALFADGAAAAILASRDVASSIPHAPCAIGFPQMGAGSSLLLPQGKDWMTWRITDAGFAMTLTRDVPVALRGAIAGFVQAMRVPRNATLIVHPGGPGVLDAVDDALGLNGGKGVELSRDVLRRFGNMSSGTVLFVLEEAMRHACRTPMAMLAFGPGLTIEGLRLEHASLRRTGIGSFSK
jgi:predicted naringenin-chalcone synthase